ncbi:MAG: protein-glutamate O-methyltransferase CheR [Pelosinus sp.]|nr:protein-glutamate O-methyltransferase CheR [Pelosinus sp.]
MDITEKEFRQLADYIKLHYGIRLGLEKMALVVGRLQNYLVQNNFTSFSAYFKYVIADHTGQAAVELMNRITTNHTYFMREADHFYFFRDKVLPYLESKVQDKDLRIWSAGCSSGEEPYTLTMLLADYFGSKKYLWNTKILATDLSDKVLGHAQDGIYLNTDLAVLPEHWKKSYLKKINAETSVFIDAIKHDIIYRKFNLMEAFPFKKKFHVIFCRNVMIYFDTVTKDQLVEKFFQFMAPGGYLFIGHSESLNKDGTKYKYIMPAVYRKDNF